MKNLEQEAEEFAKRYSRNDDLDDQICGVSIVSFEAGAKSKWVEVERIKAQIEVLELHIEHPTKPGYKRHDVLHRIKLLKVQLKQLEDENNTIQT
jgi:hypothetical protein